MITIYRDFYEFPHLTARVTPLALLGSVAISVGFSLFGTLRGIRAAARLHPAEAMRAAPPGPGGAIVLERYRRLWRHLGSRGQMVARSVWRHRGRTAAGMTAAALGSALMLLAFYFDGSMDELIDFQFDKVLLSDVDLMLKDDRDASALLEARRLPAVDHAEPLLLVACEFRNGHRRKRGAITGVTRDARLTVPRRADGRRVAIPEAGLVMSRTLVERLDLTVGGTVRIVPIRGVRAPIDVPIARVTDGFLGMSTYADYDYLNALVHEEAAVSAIQLETRRDRTALAALFDAVKNAPAVQTYADNEQTKASLIRTLLDTMKISITALILFAGAIFLGSIVTTSLVAIAERQREIATFLVMGYSLRHVAGIFLRESLLVNLAGAALGVPLGFALILVLIEEYNTELYRLPLVFGPGSVALVLALSLLFTLLAHLLVRRALARLDWRLALNARE